MQPQFGFVVDEIPIEDYKRLYDTEEIDDIGWDQAGKLSEGWIGTETVRVAEYWYVEHETSEISRKNPETGEDETRIIDKPKVCYCKINGYQVLPKTETRWLGKRIPIWAVLGKSMIVDGKPMVLSLVRFQRDPQTLINFYKTRIAETLATQPIQPYIVVKGQITKANEKQWAEMNTTLRPYLEVEGVDIKGKPAPMPERQVLEAPIQSLSEAAAQEIDDMKATAGIYDASLGARSNETSGKAIIKREQQSSATNMHFIDNLERSFDESGCELAYVIPKYYDAARTVRILGEDETAKIVKINQAFKQQNGKEKHYKIGGDGIPKYDVIVTMGRSFSTKRMESFDMIAQLLQGNPNLLPMIGDILFRNSDLAGAQQLSERFKKMLPAQLQDNDQNDPAARCPSPTSPTCSSQRAIKSD
jgi:hypothetical protein